MNLKDRVNKIIPWELLPLSALSASVVIQNT